MYHYCMAGVEVRASQEASADTAPSPPTRAGRGRGCFLLLSMQNPLNTTGGCWPQCWVVMDVQIPHVVSIDLLEREGTTDFFLKTDFSILDG